MIFGIISSILSFFFPLNCASRIILCDSLKRLRRRLDFEVGIRPLMSGVVTTSNGAEG
jgi:hypothetical protein